MLIRIGTYMFNPSHVDHCWIHSDGLDFGKRLVLYFAGGTDLTFVGDEAVMVWNYLVKCHGFAINFENFIGNEEDDLE